MKKPIVMGGTGPWGSYCDCREYRVQLHETEEEAIQAVAWIDGIGCGGMCRKKHWVARYYNVATTTEGVEWDRVIAIAEGRA